MVEPRWRSRMGESMHVLLRVSAAIDAVIAIIGRIGGWAAILLMTVVMYDVITRYFSFPHVFGLNATQLQEAEYWLHTMLFTLVIGYAYSRQSHVRIDLVRGRLPLRAKFLIEIIGCAALLIPFCLMAVYFNFNYAQASFLEGESSKSVIGLKHVWILKAFLPLMFVLLLFAAVSQLIKAVAGFMGRLPEPLTAATIGGDA